MTITWKLVEPGHLAALGTSVSIRFIPHKEGDYSIYHGDVRKGCRTSVLALAKLNAEQMIKDLVEIGIETVS
jgi:hypothetical protein